MFNTDFKSIAPIDAKVAQKATLNKQEEIKYEKLSECFQQIREAINKGLFETTVAIPDFIYKYIINELTKYGYICTFNHRPSLISRTLLLDINWESKEDN